MVNQFRLVVFVGDVDEELSVKAKSYSPDAYLLDDQNLKNLVVDGIQKNTTVYTSIADLRSIESFFIVLRMADEVFYCPPLVWSDAENVDVLNPTQSCKGYTDLALLEVSDYVKVNGIEHAYYYPTADPLTDIRKTDSPQLWAAGCSITLGVGVSKEQRYATLLANDLNLNYSVLARNGGSIDWAAGQILRSDIHKGDIIVWGISSTERMAVVRNSKLLVGITPGNYLIDKDLEETMPLSVLCSETVFFQHLYAFEKVQNFCDKIGCKLLIIGLAVSPNMLRYLKTKENFCLYPYQLDFKNNNYNRNFIDQGSDNLHPGKLQHEKYAEFCVNKLKDLNFI